MISKIETLYNIFSYSRIDSFNKGRACERIVQVLYNGGYDVHISDEGSHNIETLCEEPKFIIVSNYSSSFKYDDDINTSGLIATLVLSEVLNNYRKKIKFILVDGEESKTLLRKHNKNAKIINLHSVGRGENILISTKNELDLPLINSDEDTVDKIDYEKIKEDIQLVTRYITNKMW